MGKCACGRFTFDNERCTECAGIPPQRWAAICRAVRVRLFAIDDGSEVRHGTYVDWCARVALNYLTDLGADPSTVTVDMISAVATIALAERPDA